MLSVSDRFWYDGKIKKLATICRNYEIYLLEVPFVKLQTTVKNYHEQGLHQLELKFLPVILTNFDGNFESTIFRVKSPFSKSKWMWPSGLRRLAGNQMINSSSLGDGKMCFRISLEFLYILITFLNIKKSLNFLIKNVKSTVKIFHIYQRYIAFLIYNFNSFHCTYW